MGRSMWDNDSDEWNRSTDSVYSDNYIPMTKKARKAMMKRKKAEQKQQRRIEKYEKKRQKLELKQQQKAFAEAEANAWMDAPESTQEVIIKQRKDNLRDFIILGIAIVVVLMAIVGGIVFFMNRLEQKVNRLLSAGNYGKAYEEIEKRYHNGKNVDDQIYDYVNACVRGGEPKRAIKSLKMLSNDCIENAEFFYDLVDILLDKNEINRTTDVMEFLYDRGGVFKILADDILDSYK